ncbi:MAG TPA: hypothetical protein VGM41_03445, partial [Chitinophagaceae bacterium]
QHGQPASDFYVGDKMPVLSFFISLCGCIFIIQIAFLLQRAGIMKWLRVVGYHSLYIYLAHVMVVAAVRIIVTNLFHSTNVPVILIPAMILGILVPMILYNLSVRMGAWWLFSLKKPVEEINHYSQVAIA